MALDVSLFNNLIIGEDATLPTDSLRISPSNTFMVYNDREGNAMSDKNSEADARTADKYTAAVTADGLATEIERENPIYCLDEGDEVTLVYTSVYTKEDTEFTGTITSTGVSYHGDLATFEVYSEDDEETRHVTLSGKIESGSGRTIGDLTKVLAERPQEITETLEEAVEEQEDEEEDEDEGGLPEDTEDWDSEDWDEWNDLAEDEYHYVSTTGNITRHCPGCGYEGTHDHPVRDRPTHSATLRHYCPVADCGRMLHDGEAEDCEDCTTEDSEDDNGDDGEQPHTDGGEDEQEDTPECPECGSEDVKEGAVPDPTHPNDTADYGCRDCGHVWDDDGERVMCDGGVAADGGEDDTWTIGGEREDEAEDNPHLHRSTWSAALACEGDDAEDERPRIGVVYRPKGGGEKRRKAGNVDRFHVDHPDQYGSELQAGDSPVPVIQFRRDDGQRMWLEGNELHTRRRQATLVGTVELITISTRNTADLPQEADDAVEQAAIRAHQHYQAEHAPRDTQDARLDSIQHGLEELEALAGEDVAQERADDMLELLQDYTGWTQ